MNKLMMAIKAYIGIGRVQENVNKALLRKYRALIAIINWLISSNFINVTWFYILNNRYAEYCEFEGVPYLNKPE